MWSLLFSAYGADVFMSTLLSTTNHVVSICTDGISFLQSNSGRNRFFSFFIQTLLLMNSLSAIISQWMLRRFQNNTTVTSLS